MREYSIPEIANIVHGEVKGAKSTSTINHIGVDTRRLLNPYTTMFVALVGKNKDGHEFILDAYQKGVRHFIVLQDYSIKFADATFIIVNDTLFALQQLSAYHRNLFSIPVVGITGSNGKTIVKEWLYQLLHTDENVCRSPKSYNSQLGVPLSVLQLEGNHTFGIFEAGISTRNEMQRLQKIIQPTIGIFTNIGPAHDAGFESMEEKVQEKMHLFQHSEKIIFCNDYELIERYVPQGVQAITWGKGDNSTYQIIAQNIIENHTHIEMHTASGGVVFSIPFTDKAYVEDCIHCVVLMLELGYEIQKISKIIAALRLLPMRLELKYGLNDCVIIDDSYSADLLSLEAALEFFRQQESRKKKTFIISAFDQSGMNDQQLLTELIRLIKVNHFQKVIAVGNLFIQNYARLNFLKVELHCFATTEDLLSQIDGIHFDREIILIKGARQYQFERVSYQLLGQSHRTVLEIDLNALSDNFDVFRSLLNKNTGIIPMVKAFSYGSGSTEIATMLEEKGVDYMAVAYVDEGVKLRKGGVKSRIMVMNPSIPEFHKMVEYQLEPEIYNASILRALIYYLETSGYNSHYPIHLKMETGMNRLGFQKEMLEDLIFILMDQDVVKVATIFSHLAASDEPSMDDFTMEQLQKFEDLSTHVMNALDYPIKRHILNSSGIVRFKDYQYDFVRLGIGLYGVDSANMIQSKLTTIGTLKTTITQIKKVPLGETVGYGRKGKRDYPVTIAIIAIGYADGYDRRYSNGVGEVYIRGQKAQIIGNICMDMCMADITHIPDAKEGDEVEIYGKNISIIDCANKIGTIPYELLTKISRRVRRVYYWN